MSRVVCAVLAIVSAVLAHSEDGWLSEPIRFPDVSAEDLNRQVRRFPAEFVQEANIVFVAFEQRQQDDINTWLPTADAIADEDDRVAVYEFPVIRDMGPLRRGFINGGMRMALRQDEVRSRTITLYLDKGRFKEALAIDVESRIYVMLVERGGLVRWRTTGPHTEAGERALRAALAELLGS